MGVDRTDYIVYGYKLPYELKNKKGEIDLWSNEFLSMIEGHPGEEFTLISDGMCGEYNVFGLKIKQCEDAWDFFQFDLVNLDAEKVKRKFREVFELNEDETVPEPHLLIFSHFS